MEGHCHLLIARFLPTLSFFPQYFPPDFLRYLFSTLCNLVVPRRLPYPVGGVESNKISWRKRGKVSKGERRGGEREPARYRTGPFSPISHIYRGESGKNTWLLLVEEGHTRAVSQRKLFGIAKGKISTSTREFLNVQHFPENRVDDFKALSSNFCGQETVA